MKLIYLATPYTHEVFKIMELRYELCNIIAARLMEAGNGVFSPISHSHPIERHMGQESCNWEFWQHQDLPILNICSEINVIDVWGWEKSIGVTGEIQRSHLLGRPIHYLDPDDYINHNSVSERALLNLLESLNDNVVA